MAEEERQNGAKDDLPPGAEFDDEDDAVPVPQKLSFLQTIKGYVSGAIVPAITYGPPYLVGMPEIDQTLIDECDLHEPSVREVHAILNEGVDPNCMDKSSYNDTPLIKLSRHCSTPDSVQIAIKLKVADLA